jgi:hypothetical protein
VNPTIDLLKKAASPNGEAAFLFAQRSWQTQSLLASDQALFMGN